MLKRHPAAADAAADHIPQNTADGGQGDPLRQDAAQFVRLFEINENLLE
jgi:hypothetical protein